MEDKSRVFDFTDIAYTSSRSIVQRNNVDSNVFVLHASFTKTTKTHQRVKEPMVAFVSAFDNFVHHRAFEIYLKLALK